LFPICPPDIDDTVFVWNFLNSRQISCPDPLALLLLNRSNTGLFFTWFTFRFQFTRNKTFWLLMLRELKNPLKSLVFWSKNESKRYDIDVVVNANFLYYLGNEIDTAPIVRHLLDIIESNLEHNCDKWYRNPFTFYYFFSRNVAKNKELERASNKIIDRILSTTHPDGKLGESSLDTALGIISLIQLSYK